MLRSRLAAQKSQIPPRQAGQIPNKFQIINSEKSQANSGWKFEIWILEFVWNLGFGTWDFRLTADFGFGFRSSLPLVAP
jgi:hypothetical protein